MFYYRAYGLTICSELELPDLISTTPLASADVVVRQGHVPPAPGHDPQAERAFHASSREAVLYWQRAGLVAVRGGREIIVDAAPHAETALPALVASGPALGVLLHQRGMLALHASAVAIDGYAVGFVGVSGEGKSTTAAAFHAAGFPLLCEDIVAFGNDADGQLFAYPALPRLKLYPQAAAALGYDARSQRVFDSADLRRSYRLEDTAPRALPLRHLFVLHSGPEQQIARMAPHHAFLETVRHSYALRFIGAHGTNAAHFRQCEQLVRQVPVWNLTRPRTLEQLPALVQSLAQQIPNLAATASDQPCHSTSN